MASSEAAYDRTNGGGGKFKKRTFRKPHTKPYDRPLTALRPTQNSITNNINNDNGWLLKIVNPASKLIIFGAHKIFSSVFRKRLLPPPPSPPPQHPSDEGNEIKYRPQETATNVAKLRVDCGGNDCSGPSYSNGVAELEDILKQKTFTRSEIDQLTALMLSRTSENSDGAEKGMSEPKLSDPQAVHAKCEKLSYLSAHENHIEHVRRGDISTPEVRSKMLPDDVASPAEIAKAYMASRPEKLSPSVLCLQNQLPKEDSYTPYNPLAKSISPAMYVTQTAVSDIGNSSNGFKTPRFRGRSAIHSMARTPYSRVHPVTAFKAAETNLSIGSGFSYHNVTENNHYKKQVLKRRSSVLENDIGSVGPIRRIRQKPNFFHIKTQSISPPSGIQATHVSGVLSNVSEVLSSMEHGSQNHSFSKVLAVNSFSGTSIRYVPSQCIGMAQKIFEQLNKLSPKGNLKKKAAVSAGNSPSHIPGMESLDFWKHSPSRQDVKKLKGSLDSVHGHNHPIETSSMVEAVSAKKVMNPSLSLSSQDGADGRSAVSCSSSKSRAAEYMMPLSIVDRSLKRHAFQISAHKDYPEMDDDVPSNEVALSTSLIEGRQHAQSPRKLVAIPDFCPWDQTIAVEKSSETKTAAQLGKTESMSLANGFSAFETAVSFPSVILSPSPANMIITDAISALPSTPKSDKVAPQIGKSNISTAFSCKSDNSPPFVCIPPSTAKDTIVEIPVSANKIEAEVVPGNTVIKSTPVFDNSVIKSEDPPSVDALANGLQTNNATLLNGVLTTVPATSASDTTDISCQKSNAIGLGSAASSILDTKPTTLASGRNDIFSVPAPTSKGTGGDVQTTAGLATTKKLTFPFQTCSTPASVSAPASTSAPSFSDQSISPSASVFGLSGSTGLSQGPIFGSDSGSPFNSGSTTASSALDSSFTCSSVFTTSPTPSIFGITSQSPKSTTYGLGGSTGLSMGPIFGSSSANPFSSGPTTASSALGNLFTSSSVSTSSSPTPSIFGFTSRTPKPATTAPASPSPTFSFGLGSSGATTTSSFIFEATTNSSSASNSAPFVFGGNSGLAASTPAMSILCFQSQPAFSSASSQPFVFASNPLTNGDQMTIEDTMTEPLSAPLVGSGYDAPPTAGRVFQFNSQQSLAAPQNAPFQPSGSLEFNGGASSFSLGTSDKSQRRIMRVKKGVRRK